MVEQAAELEAHQQAIGRLVPFLEAMRSIAEIAWRRAAQRLEPLATYHDAVLQALGTAAASLEAKDRLALLGQPRSGPVAILLITAERGLCGPFSAQLVRFGLQRAQALVAAGSDVRLLCLGSRGRALLEASGQPLLYTQPLSSLSVPSYVRVEEIAVELLEHYERGNFARLEVVHHKPTRRFQYAPVIQPLLPLALDRPAPKGPANRVLPSSDAAALVTQLLSEMTLSGLYRAVIASVVSEQLARVYAMRLAVDQARTLLDELTLAYNTARQEEVTSALLEVVAGYQSAIGDVGTSM
jgi:F-type H+-transporting ATPase subunit gamma